MSISRVSDQLVEATTLTPSAHAVGDLFIVSAYRLSSTTGITVPSDYVRITGPTGANSTNRALACKWAASSSEVFGTFTNAEFVSLTIYRGTNGPVVPGIIASVVNAASLNLLFSNLNLRQLDGTSWVHASAGINTTDTDLETPPSGLVLLDNVVGSTGEVSVYDSDGGVSSWGATSRTLSGTSGSLCRMHCELFETIAASGGGGGGVYNPFQQQRIR
jgi:hypothetical protein